MRIRVTRDVLTNRFEVVISQFYSTEAYGLLMYFLIGYSTLNQGLVEFAGNRIYVNSQDSLCSLLSVLADIKNVVPTADSTVTYINEGAPDLAFNLWPKSIYLPVNQDVLLSEFEPYRPQLKPYNP
jgi:hypothetical protein